MVAHVLDICHPDVETFISGEIIPSNPSTQSGNALNDLPNHEWMGARWQEKKTKSQSQGLIKDTTSSRLRNASVRLHPKNLGSPLPPGKCLLSLQDMFKCIPSGEVFPRSSSLCLCLYSTGLCHYCNTCATDTKTFVSTQLSLPLDTAVLEHAP